LSEKTEKLESTLPAASSKAADKIVETVEIPLTERLQKAFDDAIAIKINQMNKQIDEAVKKASERIELEVEARLRAALGVVQDPEARLSDITKLRAELLALKGEKQQAPAATSKAGPESEKTEDPFDAFEKAATAEVKPQ